MSINRDYSKVRSALYGLLNDATEEARKAPLTLFFCGLSLVVLVFTGGLEWELFYRLFNELSNYGEYWNPHLMAFSSTIFIIGFHLLAHENAGNSVVRFISKATAFLIPFYLVGAGLVLADLIMLDSEDGFTANGLGLFDEPEESIGTSIESFIKSTMQKIGTFGFAIGIGGLAILNLFIAHSLLSYIRRVLPDALHALRHKKELEAGIERIETLQLEKDEAEADLADFERTHSRDELQNKAALYMLGIIQRGLAPHEEALRNMQLVPEHSGIKPLPPRDVDQLALERMIKKVKDIDATKILNTLKKQ